MERIVLWAAGGLIGLDVLIVLSLEAGRRRAIRRRATVTSGRTR